MSDAGAPQAHSPLWPRLAAALAGFGGRLRRAYDRLLRRPMRIAFAMCAVLAAAALTARIGGAPIGLAPQALAVLVKALAWFYVIYEVLGLLFRAEPAGAYLRAHRAELLVAALLMLRLVLERDLLAWFSADGIQAEDAALTVTILTNAALALQAAMHALRRAGASTVLRLNPALVLATSFAAAILAGWGLLCLPAASRSYVAPLDHFFVAVSAVCVTGLSPIDLSLVYARTGQWIALILIQVGGLGLMTLTSFFAYFFAGRVSIRHAIFMRDLLSEESLAEVRSLVRSIALFTFVAELCGTIWLYYFSPGPPAPPAERWFSALFHSVSAFCNAGFALYTRSMIDVAPYNSAYLGGLMALIFAGGFGFPFANELWQRLRGGKRRLSIALRTGLGLHLLLLLLGAIVFLLLEQKQSLADLSLPERLQQSLFFSVSARTAGFNALPIESLHASTTLFSLFLMWVGANPGGTAGGIKTTTFLIGFAYVFQRLRGQNALQLAGRTITEESVFRAISGMLLSIVLIVGCLFALSLTESAPFLDLAFEVVSAFGTVGLSRGITANLSVAGKLTICLAMFCGRIGALTSFVALIPRRRLPRYRYPGEYVVTG
ncbi:MAG: portal protein [Leptospirales bacterium]|nr:portal protein [Leptospirales bacterium]